MSGKHVARYIFSNAMVFPMHSCAFRSSVLKNGAIHLPASHFILYHRIIYLSINIYSPGIFLLF